MRGRSRASRTCLLSSRNSRPRVIARAKADRAMKERKIKRVAGVAPVS